MDAGRKKPLSTNLPNRSSIFPNYLFERAKLHKIAKDHQESIKKLDHRLNILNYLVVAIYTLLQIMIWFYPILSEPVFAILMFISWIMFLTAMSRINKTLSNL